MSKRLKEMVYEDARWIRRLKLMGCWDEALARRESEESSRRKLESQSTTNHQGVVTQPGVNRNLNGATEKGKSGTPSSIKSGLGSKNERREKATGTSTINRRDTSSDGFINQVLLPKGSVDDNASLAEHTRPRSVSVLQILSTVRSIRTLARQEYGRVYKALAPFYFDLVRSTAVTEPMVFRSYQTPAQQAKMLAQLSSFSKSDITPGRQSREEKLNSMINVFENAVVREFEQLVQ